VARFLRAARLGWFDLVAHALDKGMDPDRRGQGERTALMQAVLGGHRQVVLLLLDRGADPSLEDAGGRTALDLAREIEDEALAGYLVHAGAPKPEREQELLFRAGDGAR